MRKSAALILRLADGGDAVKFKFIKLLTPAKGAAFTDFVIEARRFAEIAHDNHILTERVLYSWLVYCARIRKVSS